MWAYRSPTFTLWPETLTLASTFESIATSCLTFSFFFSFRLLIWQKNVCISRDGTYFYAWCVFGYFVQLLSHRNLSPNKGWVKLDLMTTTPLGFPLFSFYPHPQREKIWNFVLQNQ